MLDLELDGIVGQVTQINDMNFQSRRRLVSKAVLQKR